MAAEMTERIGRREQVQAQVAAQITTAVAATAAAAAMAAKAMRRVQDRAVVEMDGQRQRKIEWRGESGDAEGGTMAGGAGAAQAARGGKKGRKRRRRQWNPSASKRRAMKRQAMETTATTKQWQGE